MKESKTALGYFVGRPLMDYWTWWKEELASVIPLPLRQLLINTNKLVLEIADSEAEIYRIVGSKKNSIARVNIKDLGSIQVGSIIREGNATENILIIPKQQVLEKHVTFPMATEENIREVLSYEMDRLTPFTSNQVYYDYHLVSRNKQKSTIELKLIIIPKERVDNLLNDLSQIGFKPHVLTVDSDKVEKEAQINLLPMDKRARKINTLKVVNYSLSVMAVLLLVMALMLPIWDKVKYIESLEPELDKYGKSAEKIITLRKQVEKAEEEALFLVEKKQASILMLRIIDELTQIIPDDSWINQVDVADNEVHVYGESVSSASLLPIIESSKIFSNAQFRSPVTQNRQNDTERFHLSAQIMREEAL
ncbi:MAG: pilus assembly protein PilM [Chromatiales bacterium]|jgi:general secretion pathway protein L